jgi:spore maturation protein CgeB
MSASLRIAFFGSSLVSSYWNGVATYYRGLVRALAARGHRITFYEPDVRKRQRHRDIEDPPWARVVVYSGTDPDAVDRALDDARSADVIIKASDVGAFDERLDAGVLDRRRPGALSIYWDVDAPATLGRLKRDPHDALTDLVPRYDLVLVHGGGPPIVRGYLDLGARHCAPIHGAHDPETHFPVARDSAFAAHLSLLANRVPDHEARIEALFFDVARALPGRRFLLGGSGWSDRATPPNMRTSGHVPTALHNAFNGGARAVLDVGRDGMAARGFSPATRIFEAAGAAACVITDAREGVDLFFEPGKEILVASSGVEVATLLRSLDPARAQAIGAAARRRALADHTYAQRAAALLALLDGRPG